MFSIGGAVLLEVVVCAAAIAFAQRRVRAELEPTLHSYELLHREITRAVELASRDSGRAAAGRQLLVRHGSPTPPR